MWHRLGIAPINTQAECSFKFIRVGVSSVLLLSVCFLMVACGKRPPSVDAPPNVNSAAYERDYPDLSTDPSLEAEVKP